MKIFHILFQYLIAFLALLAAVFAVQPTQWKQNLSTWLGGVNLDREDWWLIFLSCMVVSVALLYYREKQQMRVWTTRKKWWDRKLPQIILNSEVLIVIDSYQGSKHEFWDSLVKRVEKAEPFHFIMLNLNKDDQMLEYCMDTSGVTEEVTDLDIKAIKHLNKKKDEAKNGGNKIIEFGNWSGISQGPLVSWIRKGKETIAAGLWQQVGGSTDLSPWLVTRSGPIFESLKKHYESLIKMARSTGKLPLLILNQNAPNKANAADRDYGG